MKNKYKIKIEFEILTDKELSDFNDLKFEIIENYKNIDYLLSNSKVNSEILIKINEN